MKAVFFVVILWLNNDQFHTTSIHVEACPPIDRVEATYERLKRQHEFKDWSALCTTVDFSRPNRERPVAPKEEELKV